MQAYAEAWEHYRVFLYRPLFAAQEKLQRRLEPAWRCVAGNCHLTRRTGEAIAAAGLVPETLIRESLRKTPPFVRPSVRGVAVKP